MLILIFYPETNLNLDLVCDTLLGWRVIIWIWSVRMTGHNLDLVCGALPQMLDLVHNMAEDAYAMARDSSSVIATDSSGGSIRVAGVTTWIVVGSCCAFLWSNPVRAPRCSSLNWSAYMSRLGVLLLPSRLWLGFYAIDIVLFHFHMLSIQAGLHRQCFCSLFTLRGPRLGNQNAVGSIHCARYHNNIIGCNCLDQSSSFCIISYLDTTVASLDIINSQPFLS
jgi:hypothetical protein